MWIGNEKQALQHSYKTKNKKLCYIQMPIIHTENLTQFVNLAHITHKGRKQKSWFKNLEVSYGLGDMGIDGRRMLMSVLKKYEVAGLSLYAPTKNDNI
jgi:hypothetical protein